jgi:hypothetical protein
LKDKTEEEEMYEDHYLAKGRRIQSLGADVEEKPAS